MIFDMFREKCDLCFFRVHGWPGARECWAVHQVQSRQGGTTAGVALSQEWRGQIRHRLPRSTGAASKPGMLPSNSGALAPSEVLQSLAMDTLLVSWGQHRNAVGHECPFTDNPSRVSPADDMQYIHGTCTNEHPNVLASLIQITTRREHHPPTHTHTHTHTLTPTHSQLI